MAVIPQSYRVGSAGYGAGQSRLNILAPGQSWFNNQAHGGARLGQRPARSGRRIPIGGSNYLDINELIGKRISEMRKQQAPNILGSYKRAADSILGNADQIADQSEASYLAQGGNRGGLNSALFAGAMKNQSMIPAFAEAERLKAEGEQEQLRVNRQHEQDWLNLTMQLNQIWQRELERRAAQEQMRGSSQQGGGGISGVRIGSSAQAGGQMSPPDPWHFLRDAWGNLNATGRAMEAAGTLPPTPPGSQRR